jgi:serine/threonine protein phosphatase PrpC
MICLACGANSREGAHFCRNCGVSLEAQVVPEQPGAVEHEAPAAEGAAPAVSEIGPEAETVHPAEAEAAAEDAPAAELPSDAPQTAEEGAQRLAPGQAPGSEAAEETAPPLDEPLPAEQEGSPSPLVPLPTGMVVANRYVLLSASEVRPSEIVYDARDLCRCWQCSFEGNRPDDAYCAQCGASLDRKQVRLIQVRDDQAAREGSEAVEAHLSHEGFAFLVVAKEEPESAEVSTPQHTRLIVGQRTDVGQARELNEDSMLALTLVSTFESIPKPILGFFAVADGMGGHEGGEVASRLALQVLADAVVGRILLAELSGNATPDPDVAKSLAGAVGEVNDAVYLARQKRETDMGTTLTAAFVRDGSLIVAHVGDSRAYRWNADGLKQLTVDHSVIASMVASGRAAAEEIYTHPQRSVIYRCIGDRPSVEVDAQVLPLAPGERLILCSDGLWEMIRSEGIEDVMLQEPDPQVACDVMVRRANAAGGEDNISVIVVQVEAAPVAVG